jgi:hypothetical protein
MLYSHSIKVRCVYVCVSIGTMLCPGLRVNNSSIRENLLSNLLFQFFSHCRESSVCNPASYPVGVCVFVSCRNRGRSVKEVTQHQLEDTWKHMPLCCGACLSSRKNVVCICNIIPRCNINCRECCGSLRSIKFFPFTVYVAL